MRVVTVLGTRPEIIRLSRIIARLDSLCDHVLVHTGQNYDSRLSDIFFEELGVRGPDHYLGARGTFGEQAAIIFPRVESLLGTLRPDRFLVLGDTNSALSAVCAKRAGIPVFHLEAGNRCYDDRVPEEVNRRIVDQCSDVLMPYTERSRQNLLAEGFAGRRVHVIGNPIYEVLTHYGPAVEGSTVLQALGLEPRRYILATLHRAENVDVPPRLRDLVAGYDRLQERYGVPVIVSTHPHTRARMQEHAIGADSPHVRFTEPFGLFDFVRLEREAMLVLSDSGTVQEECAIFGVPNVTTRDVTERPETIESGTNILAGAAPDDIVRAAAVALSSTGRPSPPPEYLVPHVSDTVGKIVLGFRHHGC
jgi:UDP-N-acetylglucosamine 2-epimerase (non-hydrolysing)